MRSQLHKAVEGVSTLACESLNLSLWKFVETENHGPIFKLRSLNLSLWNLIIPI